MMTFVIDEDMPRSTAGVLKANKGYKVLDIRDHVLKGESDEKVFRFAQLKGAVLLIGDGIWKYLTLPCQESFRKLDDNSEYSRSKNSFFKTNKKSLPG